MDSRFDVDFVRSSDCRALRHRFQKRNERGRTNGTENENENGRTISKCLHVLVRCKLNTVARANTTYDVS